MQTCILFIKSLIGVQCDYRLLEVGPCTEAYVSCVDSLIPTLSERVISILYVPAFTTVKLGVLIEMRELARVCSSLVYLSALNWLLSSMKELDVLTTASSLLLYTRVVMVYSFSNLILKKRDCSVNA